MVSFPLNFLALARKRNFPVDEKEGRQLFFPVLAGERRRKREHCQPSFRLPPPPFSAARGGVSISSTALFFSRDFFAVGKSRGCGSPPWELRIHRPPCFFFWNVDYSGGPRWRILFSPSPPPIFPPKTSALDRRFPLFFFPPPLSPFFFFFPAYWKELVHASEKRTLGAPLLHPFLGTGFFFLLPPSPPPSSFLGK